MKSPRRRRQTVIGSMGVVLLVASLGGCKPPPNSASAPSPSSSTTAPGSATPAAPAQNVASVPLPPDSEDVQKLFAMGARPRPLLGATKTSYTNDTLQEVWFKHSEVPKRITDADIAILERFPNLKELSVDTEELTDASMPMIGRKTGLKLLALRNMPITDAGLAYLSGLTQLESLNLDGTPVADAGLAILDNMPNMKYLSLQGCGGVSDQSIDRLSKLKGMRTLSLQSTSVTEEGRLRLKQALTMAAVLAGPLEQNANRYQQ